MLRPGGESPLEVQVELIACFKNEDPKTYENYLNLTEGELKTYLDWIYSAKTDETKAERIIRMMDRLQKNLKHSVKKEN